MFGFGLKDKAKKILENDIGIRRPTQVGLITLLNKENLKISMNMMLL